MFALQCIGSLGNLLPLAEYIHSSADEMLIWGPAMNMFETSPGISQHGFTEWAISLIKYLPKSWEALILRAWV